MKMITRLEFELTYYNVAVQYASHNTGFTLWIRLELHKNTKLGNNDLLIF